MASVGGSVIITEYSCRSARRSGRGSRRATRIRLPDAASGSGELPAVQHPHPELGRRAGVAQAEAERDLVQTVPIGHDLPPLDRHRVGPVQQRDGVEVGHVPARAARRAGRGRAGGEHLGQPPARLVHPPPRGPHVPAQLACEPVDPVLQLQHPLGLGLDAERGPDGHGQLVRQLVGGPVEPVDQLGPDDREGVAVGDPADPGAAPVRPGRRPCDGVVHHRGGRP